MKSNETGVVCILGMHRSGTSSLTGCLEAHGLFLGDVVNAAPHNRKGNKENVPLRAINDAVLAANAGRWDLPPATLNWDDDLRGRRDAHVRQYEHVARWGFKDPRTVLTLPFWTEALPELRLIATFRRPEMVVASMEKRRGLEPATSTLELWKTYNRKILDHATRHDISIVCFDWPQEVYLEVIGLIAANLGLSEGIESNDFYDEGLRHRAGDEHSKIEIDAEAEDIYGQLMELAMASRDRLKGTLANYA